MVFMPHWPQLLGSKPIDLGLDRVLTLLDALGNPHHILPPVVHVAGTNGKGSTIAFLKSILQAAGYKVHVYTSPHLSHFNERIVLNGHPIDDDTLHQVMEECRIAAEKTGIPVTFFEGTTAGAFLAFSRHDADIVLLETGLGGRLDATNVIEHPALTIITSISMDHMEYLGNHVDIIAREKAGIMKQGSICISSMQYDSVATTLEQCAETIDCPLVSFGYDWHSEHDRDRGQLLYYDKHRDQTSYFPLPNLPGQHQIINAGNAIAAIKHLKNFNVSDDHIAKGLTQAKWPARLERIIHGRLPNMLPKNKSWELWLDGAHNAAASHVLAESLHDLNPMPLVIIIGMTKGRNIQEFLAPFKPFNPTIIGVLIETEPSAYRAEYVQKQSEENGFSAHAADSIENALELASTFPHDKARVLCTGSLYLASDIYKANAS